MTKRLRYRLHAGTASILLVFMVLSLVSFAVLTLADARSDLALSEKKAARTKAFYQAVSGAETFLATLPPLEAGTVLTKEFPVDERQTLVVSVELLAPENETDAEDAPAYRILTYRVETDESDLSYEETPLLLPR
ncbi:MAG: hypothetical protein IJQ12_04495 [Lachnospiraceae bacterium]|nr:hypothetical protein [Lachnospiraceae bacterium]